MYTNINKFFYAIWITIGKLFLNFAKSKREGNTRHNKHNLCFTIYSKG